MSIPAERHRAARAGARARARRRPRAGVGQRDRRAHVPHRRRALHQVRAAQRGDVVRRRRPSDWRGPAGSRPCRRCSSSAADDTHEWLVDRGRFRARAPSRRAGSPHPATAVRAVGEALRALHEALPVDECPFEWSVPSRLANAARARHPCARRTARRHRRSTGSSSATATRAVRTRSSATTAVDRPRRSRRARRRRPLGRHRRGGDEHRVELRTRVGGRAHRRRTASHPTASGSLTTGSSGTRPDDSRATRR